MLTSCSGEHPPNTTATLSLSVIVAAAAPHLRENRLDHTPPAGSRATFPHDLLDGTEDHRRIPARSGRFGYPAVQRRSDEMGGKTVYARTDGLNHPL